MASRLLTGWFLPVALTTFIAAHSILNAEWFQRQLGVYFPVVTEITVTSVEDVMVDEQQGVKLAGDALKLMNCKYLGIEWKLVGPQGVTVTARFSDPPKVNPTGELHWDGLLVGISRERLVSTYGEVVHSCFGVHIRSRLYPKLN